METVETENDTRLFNDYSKIKKTNKMCEIMVSDGKIGVCRQLYDDVMGGSINTDEYIDRMKGKFKTNKKLVKAIDFINKEKTDS